MGRLARWCRAGRVREGSGGGRCEDPLVACEPGVLYVVWRRAGMARSTGTPVAATPAEYGVTLILGVGGDNGHHADYIEIGRRQIGTYTAGAVSVARLLSFAAAAAFVGSRPWSR